MKTFTLTFLSMMLLTGCATKSPAASLPTNTPPIPHELNVFYNTGHAQDFSSAWYLQTNAPDFSPNLQTATISSNWISVGTNCCLYVNAAGVLEADFPLSSLPTNTPVLVTSVSQNNLGGVSTNNPIAWFTNTPLASVPIPSSSSGMTAK